MRSVCSQANSILTASILQVIDQLGGSPGWQCKPPGPSLAASQTCPCYALLVNSLPSELGASQLACCREVLFC